MLQLWPAERAMFCIHGWWVWWGKGSFPEFTLNTLWLGIILRGLVWCVPGCHGCTLVTWRNVRHCCTAATDHCWWSGCHLCCTQPPLSSSGAGRGTLGRRWRHCVTADGDTGLLVTVSTSGPGSTLATEVLGRPSRAHPAVATLEWSGVVSRPSLALACVHCASHSYHTHTDTTAIS